MKKVLKIIFYIILYAVVFCLGFAAGLIDTVRDNPVEITAQCSGFGVKKSMAAVYESRDGVVLRDERVDSATYTTTCTCYAADNNHDTTEIVSVELSSSDETVHEECASVCAAYCNAKLADFKFME